ncbi:MAG: 1-acyl-sn-glycerol-3-phosphate acyltransferase [Myxococcales bacterium]|nr:1-acyl-sn-glycerol-3-phosphate acyltransferase [Myxococcales bacterium]
MADEFWRQLKWTEKVGCAVGSGLAHNRLARGAVTQYQDRIVVPVLGQTINNRLDTRGLDRVPQGESFVLAANHRSYFDLYAVMLACWRAFERRPHLYCPVRTGFFYEKPAGVLLNLMVAGNAMYPPVFRDQRGRVLNRYAVDQSVRLLAEDPRCIVAMHPEGKRNTGPDRYTFLPPKAGVGRIALRSGRPIVPAFVAGLPASFGALVKDRVSVDGVPVRVWFGPGVDASDLAGREDPEAEMALTERTMDAIAALGEQDRAEFGDQPY